MDWTQFSPEGSSITVQCRRSDDGFNWTEWATCTNGAQIPYIHEDTPLYNTRLSFRVILQTSDYAVQPTFQPTITLSIEPVMVFHNKGNLASQPELWITKVGNGDFSMTNISNNGEVFQFDSLINAETVYVNNEQQHIESSLPVTYRYQNFNDNYLSLPPGKNIFRISGDADIQWRYQYRII